jgi:PAS domain S-box-containing protein
MILALDGTALGVSFMATIGAMVAGYFGYLGLKAQVGKLGEDVTEQVSTLDNSNTSQHGENLKVLHRIVDTLAEHGILVAAMFTAQPKPFFKGDPQGNIVEANRAAQEFFGLSRKEILGDGWIKAVHPDDKARVLLDWMEANRDKKTFGPILVKYVNQTSGHILLGEALATPVFGGIDRDHIVSWVAFITPVTGFEETEEGVNYVRNQEC